MPRTTQGQRRHEERWLARRIAWEKSRRKWSNSDLVREMAKVGCPLDKSAIQKILGGTPRPRSISTNELAAFADVFSVSVTDLLKPLEEALGDEATRLLDQLHQHRMELMGAIAAMAYDVREIARFMILEEQLTPRLIEAMARHDGAMMTLVDVALEAEAALREEDVSTYADPFEEDD